MLDQVEILLADAPDTAAKLDAMPLPCAPPSPATPARWARPPAGNTPATSGSDFTVRLWDTDIFNDLRTPIAGVCSIAGRSMTPREWRQCVPAGVKYRPICP